MPWWMYVGLYGAPIWHTYRHALRRGLIKDYEEDMENYGYYMAFQAAKDLATFEAIMSAVFWPFYWTLLPIKMRSDAHAKAIMDTLKEMQEFDERKKKKRY